jgi:hypothetical protein
VHGTPDRCPVLGSTWGLGRAGRHSPVCVQAARSALRLENRAKVLARKARGQKYSRCRGVSFNLKRNMFYVNISINGVVTFCGFFDDEDTAGERADAVSARCGNSWRNFVDGKFVESSFDQALNLALNRSIIKKKSQLRGVQQSSSKSNAKAPWRASVKVSHCRWKNRACDLAKAGRKCRCEPKHTVCSKRCADETRQPAQLLSEIDKFTQTRQGDSDSRAPSSSRECRSYESRDGQLEGLSIARIGVRS